MNYKNQTTIYCVFTITPLKLNCQSLNLQLKIKLKHYLLQKIKNDHFLKNVDFRQKVSRLCYFRLKFFLEPELQLISCSELDQAKTAQQNDHGAKKGFYD